MIRLINKDGSIIVSAEDFSSALLSACPNDKIFVDRITQDIQTYNDLCLSEYKGEFIVKTKEYDPPTPSDHDGRSKQWLIPDEFKTIDIRSHVISLCTTQEEIERAETELDMFAERDLFPILRLMIYIVSEFRKNKIVWGVGRGSSCASFVLYLIGIHKINSLKYDLDINEFLKV